MRGVDTSTFQLDWSAAVICWMGHDLERHASVRPVPRTARVQVTKSGKTGGCHVCRVGIHLPKSSRFPPVMTGERTPSPWGTRRTPLGKGAARNRQRAVRVGPSQNLPRPLLHVTFKRGEQWGGGWKMAAGGDSGRRRLRLLRGHQPASSWPARSSWLPVAAAPLRATWRHAPRPPPYRPL